MVDTKSERRFRGSTPLGSTGHGSTTHLIPLFGTCIVAASIRHYSSEINDHVKRFIASQRLVYSLHRFYSASADQGRGIVVFWPL